MTDLPAFYPKQLINEVNARITKGFKIHTLVIWTKHPGSLFAPPLFEYLLKLKESGTQLFLHITISGMGKIPMGIDNKRQPVYPEPNVPATKESLALLPSLIELTGKPQRIKIRIDPIIRFKDFSGETHSNLQYFEPILATCIKENIQNFVFSFLEKGMHKKVDARFKNKGLEILSPTETERECTKKWIHNLGNKYGAKIASCCVPGLTESSCIDGKLLEQLHDNKMPVSLKQPRSRPLCGCTASVDIGGWPVKVCQSACLYCYARPATY
jgi:hypothetical protein